MSKQIGRYTQSEPDGAPEIAPTASAVAPRRAAKPKHRTLRLVFLVISLFLVLALLFGSWYVIRAYSALNDIKREDLLSHASTRPTPLPSDPAAGSPITFLLLGSDTRPQETDLGRSDTIILGYLPPNRENLYLISIPRDCWVRIPHRGMAKINAAYFYGGPQLTAETVESLVNIPIEHAAIVDFKGFIKLTDILGGVTVDNPFPGSQYGYHFPKGIITLKGNQALSYVREREDLALGDLDRAERQRLVIQAILKKIIDQGTLKNPIAFNELLDQAKDIITLSNSLTNSQILGIASSLKFSSASDIRLLQLHLSKFDTIDQQSVDIIDRRALDDLSWALRNNKMDRYYYAYKDQPKVGGPPVEMSREP